MTIDEMNKYILHYLKADKTHSAIMLTGAWGSGKSYYISTLSAASLILTHRMSTTTARPRLRSAKRS